MTNKSDTFSDQEFKYLKKELRLSYFTWVTGFLIGMFLIQTMIFVGTDSIDIPKFEIWLIPVALILTYLLIRYFTRELRAEIRDGRKIIVLKLIEDKYDFMDRQDRFSPEIKKHVIRADGQKYIVMEEQYKKAEVGDYLAIHITPVRELTIKTEVIKA